MARNGRKRGGCLAALLNIATILLFLAALLLVGGGVLFFVAPERLPVQVDGVVARLQELMPATRLPDAPTPTLVAVLELPSATATPRI